MELRIGTRSSPMALAQARRVATLLGGGGEIVPLSTSGDRWGGALAALGGKGAFVKELDRAQLDGAVDIVVHCLKDIPGDVPPPDGLVLAAFLERDDVRDCVVGARLRDLPAGGRVGTSSVRRSAGLRRAYPKLVPVPVRGAAGTRLDLLDWGAVDALVLAVAGLERIDRRSRIGEILPFDVVLPAVGAGVLVVQCRADDPKALAAVRRLDHAPTRACATAERSMLRALSGHCHSPIGAHCVDDGDGLTLRGAVYSPDGSTVIKATDRGGEPGKLGVAVASALIAQGAGRLLDAIAHQPSRGR